MLSELMLVQDILIASDRDRSTPAHVVAVVRCPHTVKVRPPIQPPHSLVHVLPPGLLSSLCCFLLEKCWTSSQDACSTRCNLFY